MSELLRAIVRSYDADEHSATVELVDAPFAQLGGVPVLHDVPPALLSTGSKALVLRWSDVGLLVLGTYEEARPDWTLPRDLRVARDLRVDRDRLQYYDVLHQLYAPQPSIKIGLTSGTYIDLVTCSSPGSGSFSTHHGVCAGTLHVTYLGRTTGGVAAVYSALYQVTVEAVAASNLRSAIGLLGTAQTLGTAPSVTLREKAGASKHLLTLEIAVSYASMDSAYQNLACKLEMLSCALNVGNYVTPTLA
jgi:hypothetical protein